MFAIASRHLAANWRATTVRSRPREEAPTSAPVRQPISANPILALAERHSPGFQKFRALCVIAFIAAVAVCFIGPAMKPFILFGILATLHLGLSFEVSSTAAKLLAESRHSGLLELLLTTSLREDEIAAGHLLALKRSIFKAMVILGVVGACWLFYISRIASVGQFGPILFGYATLFGCHLCELWFNCRIGLWQGLQKGNPNRAYRSTTLAIGAASGICVLVIFAMVGSVAAAADFEAIPIVAICSALVSLPAVLSAWFISASANLTDKMREMASTPIGITSSQTH
jgi:hypothetical protein